MTFFVLAAIGQSAESVCQDLASYDPWLRRGGGQHVNECEAPFGWTTEQYYNVEV